MNYMADKMLYMKVDFHVLIQVWNMLLPSNYHIGFFTPGKQMSMVQVYLIWVGSMIDVRATTNIQPSYDFGQFVNVCSCKKIGNL